MIFMISERTLKKWRREALKLKENPKNGFVDDRWTTETERVLKLTQELLDQHLIRR